LEGKGGKEKHHISSEETNGVQKTHQEKGADSPVYPEGKKKKNVAVFTESGKKKGGGEFLLRGWRQKKSLLKQGGEKRLGVDCKGGKGKKIAGKKRDHLSKRKDRRATRKRRKSAISRSGEREERTLIFKEGTEVPAIGGGGFWSRNIQGEWGGGGLAG